MATSSDAGVPKPTEAGLTHWEIAGEFKGEGGYMNQWKGTTMRKDLKRLFVKDDAMQPSHVIDKLVCVGLGSLSFRSSYRPHDEALRKRSFWQLACFMDLTTLLKDLEVRTDARNACLATQRSILTLIGAIQDQDRRQTHPHRSGPRVQ